MGTVYADDLALLAESKEKLLEMTRQWKDGMGKIAKRNLQERCWKKLDMLHKMQRSGFTKSAVGFGVVWKL